MGGELSPPDNVELLEAESLEFEVLNTDAEGRLLLADGVSYAANELSVDYVFDAATLTGSSVATINSIINKVNAMKTQALAAKAWRRGRTGRWHRKKRRRHPRGC